jgi:hypothetical protein
MTNKRTAEEAQALIEDGEVAYVAGNLKSFKGLSAAMAWELINAGEVEAVAGNLSRFEGLNSEIAHAIIATKHGGMVTANLRRFEGWGHVEAAHAIIEAEFGWTVAYFLSYFDGLNYVDTAHTIIEATPAGAWAIAHYLGNFFEKILCDEPDALLAGRHLVQGARERDEKITSDEFDGLLKAARAVAAHKPAVRGLPAHAG